MNGYSLTKKMRNTRQQLQLRAIDQLLYFELVSVCNELKWPKVFHYSNSKLCDALGISMGTLSKARKKLQHSHLIYFWSGKKNGLPGCYSFMASEELLKTPGVFAPDGIDPLSPDDHPPLSPDDYPPLSPGDHYNINYNKTINTPLTPQGVVGEHKKFIAFDAIKELLLADQTWKEQIAMHSGLSVKFLDILPAQIDIFLNYIIATGATHTVLTLSDAKRRFFWWWKSQGKDTYEASTKNTETIIW